MPNAPTDEPIPELNEDLVPERGDGEPAVDQSKPGIIAGVGSSALGATDAPTNTEPQRDRQPDNDGETVEQ